MYLRMVSHGDWISLGNTGQTCSKRSISRTMIMSSHFPTWCGYEGYVICCICRYRRGSIWNSNHECDRGVGRVGKDKHWVSLCLGVPNKINIKNIPGETTVLKGKMLDPRVPFDQEFIDAGKWNWKTVPPLWKPTWDLENRLQHGNASKNVCGGAADRNSRSVDPKDPICNEMFPMDDKLSPSRKW